MIVAVVDGDGGVVSGESGAQVERRTWLLGSMNLPLQTSFSI